MGQGMSLFPGKAAGGTSGNSSWSVSLGFTLPWLSQDPTKDKIQVCASSKRGQAEVLHPGAALEAGKAVPTQGKRPGKMGMPRHGAGGGSQSQVPPDKNSFVGKHLQRGDVHRAKNKRGPLSGLGVFPKILQITRCGRALWENRERKRSLALASRIAPPAGKGRFIQVIEVTQTPRNLDPSQIPASPPERLAN